MSTLDTYDKCEPSHIGWYEYLIPSKSDPHHMHIVEHNFDTDEYRCSCKAGIYHKKCDHIRKLELFLSADYVPRFKLTEPKPFDLDGLIRYWERRYTEVLHTLLLEALKHLITNELIHGDDLDHVGLPGTRRKTSVTFRQLSAYGVIAPIGHIKSRSPDKHNQQHLLYKRMVSSDDIMRVISWITDNKTRVKEAVRS